MMGMLSRALRLKDTAGYSVVTIYSLTAMRMYEQDILKRKEASMARTSPPLRKKNQKKEVQGINHGSYHIPMDIDLLESLEIMASERGITIEELVNIRLRAIVNAHERNRLLGLQDMMPYGQYRGITIEQMIRADPRYSRWLYEVSEIFELNDEAREFLESMS